MVLEPTMTAPTSNDHERALALARTVAQLARVNTAIEKLSTQTDNTDPTLILESTNVDTDLMLAEAKDDIQLGLILFEAVESVSDVFARPGLPASAMRGIAKRPRHVTAGRTAPARPTTRHDAVLKAARVLRRALQKRFPLTWQKLLEGT